MSLRSLVFASSVMMTFCSVIVTAELANQENTTPWRSDPILAGRWHLERPDELQVLVHEGGPRLSKSPPEIIWVRITGEKKGAYRGKVLDPPHGLESVEQGDEILFLAVSTAEYPFRVSKRYLAEKNEWFIHPCHQCGFDELFDAPTDLITKLFGKSARKRTGAFTTFCPLCGGVQVVESADGEPAETFTPDVTTTRRFLSSLSWNRKLTVWPQSLGDSRPWREDDRLAGLSPEGYPDDFPVYFNNIDPTIQDETMWVTTVDYSTSSDMYLGILLNVPYDLTSVKQGDTVVFHYDDDKKRLAALMANGTYSERSLRGAIWRGIQQYRRGNYGLNRPAHRQCAQTLSGATQRFDDTVPDHDRHIAYFVLGRCNAELYNTDDAINAFQLAVKYNRDDVDAHLALLAEYSLKLHPPSSQAPADYDPSYESLFLEHIEFVRQHFSDNSWMMNNIDWIFEEPEAAEMSEMTAEEISRGRKFGFRGYRHKLK